MRGIRTAAAVAAVVLGLVAPTSAVAQDAGSQVFRTFPESEQNTIFHLSTHYFPELAQSVALTSTTQVSEIRFFINGMTQVQPAWWTTPEATRHPLEQAIFQGTVPVVQARAEIWKAPAGAALGASVNLGAGFTKVAEVTQTTPVTLTSWYPFQLPSPVTLEPGTYVVTLWLDVRDPAIITVYVAGQQSGTHTETGLLHQGPTSVCQYTPSTDLYPAGRAYRSEGAPIPFSPDAYSAPALTLTEHASKVLECVQVGRYNDIWNEGDLVVELRPPGSEAGQRSEFPEPQESRDPPSQIPTKSVTRVSASTAVLRWVPADSRSTIVRYEWRIRGGGKPFSAWHTAAATARSAKIGSLRKSKSYVVQIRAVNAGGPGPTTNAFIS